MARDQILVSVCYREIPLLRRAVLRDVDGSGGFLQTESPMPVGSMLILSPLRNAEIRVPARVALVVEACRAQRSPDGEVAGANLTFEAAGEVLLDYLEEVGAEVTEESAAPAAPGRGLEPLPALSVPAPSPAPVAPAPPEPTPEAAFAEIEPADPPAESPKVIVNLAGDPDAPDKVVLELEADYSDPPASPAPDKSGKGEGGEEEDDDEASEGEGGEASETDADKKKKSRRRRKKRR
jgi:hypothetical protein